MKLESIATLLSFDPYTQSAYAQHNLGEIVKCADGRWFRHAKNTGGLTAGLINEAPALVTDYAAMTLKSAVAIGATNLVVTTGTTATTAGILDEGVLMVASGTGQGQVAKVSHNAISSATASLSSAGYAYGMNVVVDQPFTTALIASDSTITIVPNRYNTCLTATASVVVDPVGVSLITQTTAYYGWLQVNGISGVQVYSSVTVNAGYQAGVSGSNGGYGINMSQCEIAQPVGQWIMGSSGGQTVPCLLRLS